VVVPDPVDARLLSLLAELGRAAVPDVAARLGMDPREVAARLVNLAASGLPLMVGVECDPGAIRAVLATPPPAAGPYAGFPPQGGPYGVPSGAYPVPAPPPPGGYPAYGTPSGAYPMPAGAPSGPHPVAGTPSGPYPGPVPGGPPGHPGHGPPPRTGPPSHPFPAPRVGPPSAPIPAPAAAEPSMATWGPPQTSAWTRGDQPARTIDDGPTVQTTRPGYSARSGTVGTTLETNGLEGEHLAIQLVEVVDPADYLFTAAGYRLQDGERSVVVHTELTNRGRVPFSSLPDQYLVLITPEGRAITKAPVSLSSRPPHRIGVAPGETAGGHTVYVLPDTVEVRGVRWSPRPDDEQRTLTWTVEA